MSDDVTPDEQMIINQTLQRLRTNTRHPIPSGKVKQFLQMIGDELKRTGELKKEFVDRLLQQLKAGEG
jgi:hypothetical protein